MSLLDTASLIVTPNGYKEGKLYSVIPSDGSGDMSVTRATTATRVNSAGLVELVPYNLLSYSQDIENADWYTYQANVTANDITAPDGTLTADKITQTGAGAGTFYKAPFVLNGGLITLSCYYKKGTNNVAVLEVNITGGNCTIFYNLDTEVITATGSYVSTNMEDVGDGWYRCSVVTNSPSGTANYIAFGNIGNNGDTLYAWGAQLVEGSTAKDYQKTETRLNIPRLDYSNGTCPSLLVEPQRTNMCVYSNDLTGWINQIYNTTLTRIQTGGPDGNAFDRLVTTGSGNQGRYVQTSFLTGSNAVFSVYLKGSGIADIAIYNAGQSSLDTITLTSEWTRYETKITSGTTGYIDWSIFSFGGSTIDVAFSQMEFGSYATSYIPTTSASVTRNADIISKTGISSLIGQTEGTLFLDFYYDGTTNNHMIINDSSFNSYIYFNSQNANQLWAQIQNINIQFSASATAGRHKLALAYKSGSSAFYLDGVQVGTSATTFTLSGSMSILDFTLTTPNNAINAAALWKTRLTNTQLAQLTTI